MSRRPGWFDFSIAPLGNAFTQVGGQELRTVAANRCQSLADRGRVTGATTADQTNDALKKMWAYGSTNLNSNALHVSHYRLANVYVALGCVAAYGKFSVADNICGFSLTNVNATGIVVAQAATKTRLFAASNCLNTGADVT